MNVPVAPIPIGATPTKGSRSAKIAIVEFSEFECPYCRRFAHDTLPNLVTSYVDTGQVLLVFRHLPLERIHRSARAAADIAACAESQGLFWQVHDSFFKAPATSTEEFRNRSFVAGLDRTWLDSCLATTSTKQTVLDDIELANRLGVTGTPAFFIGLNTVNGVQVEKVLLGNRPLAEFRVALDQLLK